MQNLETVIRQDRSNASITGIFFITAAVTSIAGLILYDPILNHTDFLTAGPEHQTQIITAAVFEALLACSAIGTAIMLYPYLKKHNESLGLGYVLFRTLEVLFILIGTMSMLALLSLGLSSPGTENADLQSVGEMLQRMYRWTLLLGPNLMLGINTSIYSYVLYKTGLVPSWISILGRIGGLLVFIVAFLEMYGLVDQLSIWGMLFALPIFAYEMSLAVRLIAKGFIVRQ